MKKIHILIMLTFFACCATIILVGCENGNQNINELESGEIKVVESSGEEEIEKDSRRNNKRPERRSL